MTGPHSLPDPRSLTETGRTITRITVDLRTVGEDLEQARAGLADMTAERFEAQATITRYRKALEAIAGIGYPPRQPDGVPLDGDILGKAITLARDALKETRS